MIATACSGGMISASMGVATMPMPTKPPLARPSSVTAITAMVQNSGSAGRVKGVSFCGGSNSAPMRRR